MPTYISSFITGLQEPIVQICKQELDQLQVVDVLDGLIIYKTTSSEEKIKGLRFFSNTFEYIQQFPHLHKQPIEKMAKKIQQDPLVRQHLQRISIPTKNKSFRVIFSLENQLVPIDKMLRHQVEKYIAKHTGSPLNRVKPDQEYWFLYRSEQIGFFMRRLTKTSATEKQAYKGELRRELASVLCFMSEPAATDVFLDPFCGYGSLSLERAIAGKFERIYAEDKEDNLIEIIKERKKTLPKHKWKMMITRSADFLTSKKHRDESISKIVTDPPWGLYTDMEGSETLFYRQMMQELSRIMQSGALLILLTARKEEFEEALQNNQKQLELLHKYDILVSGKKASIYKIRKAALK